MESFKVVKMSRVEDPGQDNQEWWEEVNEEINKIGFKPRRSPHKVNRGTRIPVHVQGPLYINPLGDSEVECIKNLRERVNQSTLHNLDMRLDHKMQVVDHNVEVMRLEQKLQQSERLCQNLKSKLILQNKNMKAEKTRNAECDVEHQKMEHKQQGECFDLKHKMHELEHALSVHEEEMAVMRNKLFEEFEQKHRTIIERASQKEKKLVDENRHLKDAICEHDTTITNLQDQIDQAEMLISRQANMIQRQTSELEKIGPHSKLRAFIEEQDVTITKLRHQIDEAEVEISRQAKLIQSQALELEEIGPCSEFLCKHERQEKTIDELPLELYKMKEKDSLLSEFIRHEADQFEENAELQSTILRKFEVGLQNLDLRLKFEKSSRFIAEGQKKSLEKEHALIQSALNEEKARSDQLSRSLRSAQEQMENLEKRLQEQFIEAQHRVSHLEAQLHSSKEELCGSEASLKLVKEQQKCLETTHEEFMKELFILLSSYLPLHNNNTGYKVGDENLLEDSTKLRDCFEQTLSDLRIYLEDSSRQVEVLTTVNEEKTKECELYNSRFQEAVKEAGIRVTELEMNLETERLSHMKSNIETDMVRVRLRDLETVLEMEKVSRTIVEEKLQLLHKQHGLTECALEKGNTHSAQLSQSLECVQQGMASSDKYLQEQLEAAKQMVSDLEVQLQSSQQALAGRKK